MIRTLRRVAIIGNSLPRRCGIATFTTDLQQAIEGSAADVDAVIVAMNDQGRFYDYPSAVGFEIADHAPDEYANAAGFLNAGAFDVICLQHEFGIFGGDAGGLLMPLLTRLEAPLVTTLHTVLADPTVEQAQVMAKVIEASAKVVVMAEKGRQLLRDVYRAPGHKIEIIPHGVPDFPLVEPDGAKAELGFSGKAVILTFGLLSPNKGVEVMIDAMPSILTRRPDAIYVVLGATHPTLVRREGESYRERLMARVRDLGIDDHVVFRDQFVDKATLLGFIAMCDVYVTPYLSEGQMTSGTLAYSFGLGKAVVSTPYWHARELLADDRGILVPFRDAPALSEAISGLLTDDVRRQAMRKRAYAASRSMTWARTAERYLEVFSSVGGARALKQPKHIVVQHDARSPPEFKFEHLASMCDDTGLLQHAVHSVADRAHGYCVDDNARALLLACSVNAPGEQPLPDGLTARFAAFVQHAWNPDLGRFRNFMSFDRRWLEPSGSEDSHGRTLWALGACARDDADPSRRRWATGLFAAALPVVENFTSPRAWAFTLLGLEFYCAAHPRDAAAQWMRRALANRLVALMAQVETNEWAWFEPGLSYDNARLPQALIVTGASAATAAYTRTGLRSLSWLMRQQTTPERLFRPVGTEGYGALRAPPMAFDQQPVEAAATISACLAAYRADGDDEWRRGAERAFAWFFGANDLAAPLVDVATGSCRDGLHADRANENRGAESMLSYLLGLAEIRALTRMSSGHQIVCPRDRRLR